MFSRFSVSSVSSLLASFAPAKDKSKSSLPALILQGGDGCSHRQSRFGSAARQSRREPQCPIRRRARADEVGTLTGCDVSLHCRSGDLCSQGPRPQPDDCGRRSEPAAHRPATWRGSTRVGIQTGTPPRTGTGYPDDTTPRPGMEIGSPEDFFEVYRGQDANTLDGSPLWRYMGKNALRPPAVTAVEQFRKAIEEAEKQQKKQQP